MLLRDVLKQATANAHAALEQASLLADPGLTIQGYALYLERMWGYCVEIEPRLIESPELSVSLACSMNERRKLQWLESDLHYFSGGSVRLDRLPRCNFVPPVHSLASAIGCAYVLEGATLGGQILYRRFARRWGLSEAGGARYVYGYGERTARMWQQFTGAINAIRLDSRGEAECISAASSTFSTIHGWTWP